MRLIFGMAAALAMTGCGNGASGTSSAPQAVAIGAKAGPVTLRAADGVTIFARHYPVAKPKALILLFHQAGSSKDEYATIAPRLNKDGYSALAIDQRSGGDLFGPNETAARAGGAPTYLDARQDLQAALDWAGRQGAPVIVWGSSYSSALVFLLAADNPGKVKAVLSFSPGEYLGTPDLVKQAAAKVSVPVFVTSAKDAREIEAARAILAAVPGTDKEQFVPSAGGVHGSSTLIEARDAAGAAENWTAVEAFLKRVAP